MSTSSPKPARTALRKAFATLLAYPVHFLFLQLPEVSVDFVRILLQPEAQTRTWLVILILFPYFCIMSFVTNAMTFASAEQTEFQKPSLAVSWDRLLPKLSVLIPVSLITGLLYMLGLLALILPHIYFFAIYLFVPALLITEPKSPWSSYLFKSKRLAKPFLWQTLAVALVLFLVTLSFELDVKTVTGEVLPGELLYVLKVCAMATVGALCSLWISYYFMTLRAIKTT